MKDIYEALGIEEPTSFPATAPPVAYTNTKDKILRAVDRGILPEGTLDKIHAIGSDQPAAIADIMTQTMMMEVIAYSSNPEAMPIDLRHHLFSDKIRALIANDPFNKAEIKALTHGYDHAYFTSTNLAHVIEDRRIDEGKTILEVPDDRRSKTPEQEELMVCHTIAHRLWGVLVDRIKPEWVEEDQVSQFFLINLTKNKRTGQITIHQGGPEYPQMRRNIVARVALSSLAIHEIVEEAKDIGVRRIGPVGIVDLTTLLDDYHSAPGRN